MGFPVFGTFTVFLGCEQLTVPASTASLLIATIPAFTALWVVAFLEERLAAVGWAVMAVSFVGVAAISRETRAKEERPPTTYRVGAREKGARGR
jgi:drug/metabolite transporter (DMT)-like permease